MWAGAFREDLETEDLTFEGYGLLSYLFQKANPVTGDLMTNVTGISEGIGKTSKKGKRQTEYLLNNLKDKRYIWFDTKQGTRRNYKIAINHYPLIKKKDEPQKYRSIPKNSIDFSEVNDESRKSDPLVNKQEDLVEVSEVTNTNTETNTETETETENKTEHKTKGLSFFDIPVPNEFINKFKLENVQRKITVLEFQYKDGPPSNPLGLLRTALEKNFAPSDEYLEHKKLITYGTDSAPRSNNGKLEKLF